MRKSKSANDLTIAGTITDSAGASYSFSTVAHQDGEPIEPPVDPPVDPPTDPSDFSTLPGKPANPAGHAAAPGYPGSLTPAASVRNPPWTVNSGIYYINGGTAAAPINVEFIDFDNYVYMPNRYVNLKGCRVQRQGENNYAINIDGSGNINISYCTICPRLSVAPTIPLAAWPSSGAGLPTTLLTSDYNAHTIPFDSGYQYAIGIQKLVGPVGIDHNDMWGWANAIVLNTATTQEVTIDNNWIHDACRWSGGASGHTYHTDGIGYLNGGAPPSNVRITNNTIASLGSQDGIAGQSASSPYTDWTITGNYLSGFCKTFTICYNRSDGSNLVVTDNVWGTDLPWCQPWEPLDGKLAKVFGAGNPTNIWKRNKLRVVPGTAPQTIEGWPTSWSGPPPFWDKSYDGRFIVPVVGAPFRTTDWGPG